MLLGWIGPTSVYAYFVIGSLANKMLMSRVAASVFLQGSHLLLWWLLFFTFFQSEWKETLDLAMQG